MKTQKLFHPALAGSCAAAALAVFGWAIAPAGAQTATTSSTTSSPTFAVATETPTGTFTKTTTTTSVAVKGIVTGVPESVSFTGKVPVKATVVTDPQLGNPPTTVLTVDLTALVGTGRSTHATYVVGGNGIVERPLAASDTVEITFPFYRRGADASTARSGVASFALTFDVNTMQMTGASATLAGM
jgi:hypothetical protein